MLYCPENIDSLVEDANAKFPEEHDEFHHYFHLKCTCGSNRFSLAQSNKRSVEASCVKCMRASRIYDLALYTSACKLKGEEIFDQILVPGNRAAQVFIGFEYGETDDDEEFDRNDITWCNIFIEEGGHLKKIFDDETA